MKYLPPVPGGVGSHSAALLAMLNARRHYGLPTIDPHREADRPHWDVLVEFARCRCAPMPPSDYAAVAGALGLILVEVSPVYETLMHSCPALLQVRSPTLGPTVVLVIGAMNNSLHLLNYRATEPDEWVVYEAVSHSGPPRRAWHLKINGSMILP